MKRYVVATIIAAVLLCACAATAQTTEAPTGQWQPAPAPESQSGPGSLAILDLLGKLTIAVLLAWGLAWGVRWLQQHGVGRQALAGEWGSERELQLEESLSLGADGRLYLVSVGGRRILLAARDGAIRRVDLSEPKEPAEAIYHSLRQRGAAPPDELNIGRSRLSTRPVRSDVVSDSASWAQRRDQLLRQLQDT